MHAAAHEKTNDQKTNQKTSSHCNESKKVNKKEEPMLSYQLHSELKTFF